MSDKSLSSKKKDKSERVPLRVIWQIYKIFGKYYKNHWPYAVLAYVGLILTVGVAVLMPWPLKLILDYIVLQAPLPPEAAFVTDYIGTDLPALLAAMVVAFIVLRVLASIFSFMFKVGILSVGEMITTDIRQHIFSHLQRLSLSFHSASQSGDLVYRLTTDIAQLKVILVQVPQQIFYRVITIAVHIGLMMMLDWRLALVAFSILPVLYYFSRRLGSGVQGATKEKRRKESDVTSLVAENITAMALVQAYAREDHQQERFMTENRQSMASGIEAMRLSKAFKRISDILVAIGTGGVVYYGSTLVLEGTILPGTLVLFVAYLRNLYKPIEKLAAMMLNVAKSMVSGERLLELVDNKMVLEDAPDAVAVDQAQGRFEFKDVSFSYNSHATIFEHLNFKVEPGEVVALVGHSGAGKSTLISLLLRFYDPQDGQILLDGSDLRKITLKSLRSQMTILLQDAQLFNKTVRENIAFGKIGATEDEVIQAAKLAQAHDFILEMPKGYDTVISEGGANLSGGQQQRINIARAIIRQTPVLIFDEPTSALDAKSEARVQAALDHLMRGKTTFIIAHRFSTIRQADRILVLETGKPAAFGTHDELMASSDNYRNLYELQFGVQAETPAGQLVVDASNGRLLPEAAASGQ